MTDIRLHAALGLVAAVIDGAFAYGGISSSCSGASCGLLLAAGDGGRTRPFS